MNLILFILCPLLPIEDCPTPLQGHASHYAEKFMEGVIQQRQEWGQLPEDLSGWADGVAVLDCSLIGETIYIYHDVWKSYIVADCARRDNGDGTQTWMIDNNILVEVGYKTCSKWGTCGGGTKVQAIFP